MSTSIVRVIKLGGSLLGNSEWPDRLRAWLSRQATPAGVLIVGGGSVVGAIRDWDAAHHLGETASHWLAIRAMSLTARMAHALLPEAEMIDSWPRLLEADYKSKLVVFDPFTFLEQIEPTLCGQRLPISWDATSDSIAARVAFALNCDELVLLKSCLPPRGEAFDLSSLADAGFVDAWFPRVAKEIPVVRLVDLKSEVLAEVRLGTNERRQQ